MKVPATLLSFAAIGSALSAAESSYANPILAARAAQQDTCTLVNKVVAALGTSSAVLVYTTTGAVPALSVCNLLRSRKIAPTIGPDDCINYAPLVASAVAIAYTAANLNSVENAPQQSTRRSDGSMLNSVLENFESDGTSFDSVSALPIVAKRSTESTQMIEHFSISGMQYAGNSVDATVASFGNGEGHIFVTPSVASGGLTKRHNGPGFKLAYSARGPSSLSKKDREAMSRSIAEDWSKRATKNRISEWIGFAETKHTANFFLRIIPEIRGYGDNYESVDAPCGQMSKYL